MPVTKIHLHENMFAETERELLVDASFRVSLFRYPNGVCAARIQNACLTLIVLPFQGQQVWRLFAGERDLTMKSIFDAPEATTRFGLNYGAFLIHCGLTANGNPAPADSHPLHGELPNAHFQQAWLTLGSDDLGDFLTLGGSYTYRNSLEYHYTFTPELRLAAGSALAEMHIEASNHRAKAMKYMYMAHINWRPVDGARLLSSADPRHTEVFNDTFGLPTHEQEHFARYVARLENDPALADVIDPATQVYDPELCMYLHPRSDAQGYAHALQVFPDGSAAYVGFRTAELPNAVRWFARTGDEDALAFAIPSTNNHLGFSRNDEKGLVRSIAPQSTLRMAYRFGYLTREAAQQMEATIRSIR